MFPAFATLSQYHLSFSGYSTFIDMMSFSLATMNPFTSVDCYSKTHIYYITDCLGKVYI